MWPRWRAAISSAWSPAEAEVSAPFEFKVSPQWRTVAEVDDPAGDDSGPTGKYLYPTDPSWALHPLDIRHLQVESAGGALSAHSHWNQLLRSSVEEGNPSDPFSLTPFTGIHDAMGRDLGLELMTAALDPDYGLPFLSGTTIQSMRDLGYTVVPEPTAAVACIAALTVAAFRRRRFHR